MHKTTIRNGLDSIWFQFLKLVRSKTRNSASAKRQRQTDKERERERE